MLGIWVYLKLTRARRRVARRQGAIVGIGGGVLGATLILLLCVVSLLSLRRQMVLWESMGEDIDSISQHLAFQMVDSIGTIMASFLFLPSFGGLGGALGATIFSNKYEGLI